MRKHLLLLLLTLLNVCILKGNATTIGDTYELVTNIDQVESGAEYILSYGNSVSEATTSLGQRSAKDGNFSFNQVLNGIKVKDNIATIENEDVLSFIIVNNGINYSIKIGTQFLQFTTSNKTMSLQDTNSDSKANFNIEINGTSKIYTIVGEDTWALQYNSASNGQVFGNYKNTQKDCFLFKKTTITDKTKVEITFPEKEYTADLANGEAWSDAPKVTVDHEAAREYLIFSSSDENVATVNAEGEIKLKARGLTTITASLENNETYTATPATYTLKVIDSNNPVYEPAIGDTYVLVTSNEGIEDGAYYIIATTGANKAMSNTFDSSSNNVPDTSVKIEDGVLNYDGNQLVLQASVQNDGKVKWFFVNYDKKKGFANSTSQTSISFADTEDKVYATNTIFNSDDNTVKIGLNNSDNKRWIFHQAGTVNCFRHYSDSNVSTSNYSQVHLYKYTKIEKNDYVALDEQKDITLDYAGETRLELGDEHPDLIISVAPEGIINIDSDGVIKALERGTGDATVTITWNASTYWNASETPVVFNVTVNPPVKEVYNPNFEDLIGDKALIIEGTAQLNFGEPHPDKIFYVYTPEQDDIINIDEKGVITALRAGQTTVEAKWADEFFFEDGSKEFTVEVKKKTYTPNPAFEDSYSIAIGEEPLTFTQSENDPKYEFSTEPKEQNFIEIKDGVIVAKNEGDVKVTAKWGNETYAEGSASFIVTVTPEIPKALYDFYEMYGNNDADIVGKDLVNKEITLKFEKGDGNYDPQYFRTGTSVRAYPRTTFTVTASQNCKSISKIEIVSASGGSDLAITADCGNYVDGTTTSSNTPGIWTPTDENTTAVTFTIEDSKSGNRRIASINVIYIIDESIAHLKVPDFDWILNDEVSTSAVYDLNNLEANNLPVLTIKEDDISKDEIKITSSDETVATIVDGEVKVHNTGETTISASYTDTSDERKYKDRTVEYKLTVIESRKLENEEGSYTIIFGDNGNDASALVTSASLYDYVVTGAEYLVTKNAADKDDIIRVYKGKYGLKFGSDSGDGTLKLKLSDTGKRYIKEIIVKARNFRAGQTTNLKVNGSESQSLKDVDDYYTFTFNEPEQISETIEINVGTKAGYVKSLTVVYDIEDYTALDKYTEEAPFTFNIEDENPRLTLGANPPEITYTYNPEEYIEIKEDGSITANKAGLVEVSAVWEQKNHFWLKGNSTFYVDVVGKTFEPKLSDSYTLISGVEDMNIPSGSLDLKDALGLNEDRNKDINVTLTTLNNDLISIDGYVITALSDVAGIATVTVEWVGDKWQSGKIDFNIEVVRSHAFTFQATRVTDPKDIVENNLYIMLGYNGSKENEDTYMAMSAYDSSQKIYSSERARFDEDSASSKDSNEHHPLVSDAIAVVKFEKDEKEEGWHMNVNGLNDNAQYIASSFSYGNDGKTVNKIDLIDEPSDKSFVTVQKYGENTEDDRFMLLFSRIQVEKPSNATDDVTDEEDGDNEDTGSGETETEEVAPMAMAADDDKVFVTPAFQYNATSTRFSAYSSETKSVTGLYLYRLYYRQLEDLDWEDILVANVMERPNGVEFETLETGKVNTLGLMIELNKEGAEDFEVEIEGVTYRTGIDEVGTGTISVEHISYEQVEKPMKVRYIVDNIPSVQFDLTLTDVDELLSKVSLNQINTKGQHTLTAYGWDGTNAKVSLSMPYEYKYSSAPDKSHFVVDYTIDEEQFPDVTYDQVNHIATIPVYTVIELSLDDCLVASRVMDKLKDADLPSFTAKATLHFPFVYKSNPTVSDATPVDAPLNPLALDDEEVYQTKVYSTNTESIEHQISVNDNVTTGVDDTRFGNSADDDSVEFYNLQGVRVDNPVRGGVYIVRAGNKAAKVYVR